jgi:hypothetical protein
VECGHVGATACAAVEEQVVTSATSAQEKEVVWPAKLERWLRTRSRVTMARPASNGVVVSPKA